MSLALQMRSFRRSIAEILHHMPDHPGLLQSFIWQDLDLAPNVPALQKFLAFRTHNLDGTLHSERVGHAEIITPPRCYAG